jgi:hypothetical protein
MAKGAEAKQGVINKIAEAFGEDYIGEFEKKVYVWSMEGGERVQVALALTCPKNPVGEIAKPKVISTDGFGYDFENMPTVNETKDTVEYTEEEKATINKLIAELGL